MAKYVVPEKLNKEKIKTTSLEKLQIKIRQWKPGNCNCMQRLCSLAILIVDCWLLIIDWIYISASLAFRFFLLFGVYMVDLIQIKFDKASCHFTKQKKIIIFWGALCINKNYTLKKNCVKELSILKPHHMTKRPPPNFLSVFRRSILQLLAHFWPQFAFHTPWKHQKVVGFLVFRGYKNRNTGKQWINLNREILLAVKTFHGTGLFLYPLKKPKVFLCFQGA